MNKDCRVEVGPSIFSKPLGDGGVPLPCGVNIPPPWQEVLNAKTEVIAAKLEPRALPDTALSLATLPEPSSSCACIHTCTVTYTLPYAHILTHSHTYSCTHKALTCMHILTHSYTCTYTLTHMYLLMYSLVVTYMCSNTLYHIYMQLHMHLVHMTVCAITDNDDNLS